jgi:hypothetical protein
MYNPDLGTFIQRDPIAYDSGDDNLYRYCENNPVNETDPTGLAGEGCWDGRLTGRIRVKLSSVSVNKWGIIGGIGKALPGTTISVVQSAMVAFYKGMADMGWSQAYKNTCGKGEHCKGTQVDDLNVTTPLKITQWIWVKSNGGGRPTVLLPPMNAEPTDKNDLKNHKSQGYELYSVTCNAIFIGTFTGLKGSCVKDDTKNKVACTGVDSPVLV